MTVKRRPAAQPRTGPVARVACYLQHAGQDQREFCRAKRVAPGKRSLRVAETKPNGIVDIVDTGDTLLGNVAGQIDDGGQGSLSDETDAVTNESNADTVAGKKRMRGIAIGRVRGGARHQCPMTGDTREHIDADCPLRRCPCQFARHRRVVAVRRKQAQGIIGWRCTGFDLRAKFLHERDERVAIFILLRADPDRR